MIELVGALIVGKVKVVLIILSITRVYLARKTSYPEGKMLNRTMVTSETKNMSFFKIPAVCIL